MVLKAKGNYGFMPPSKSKKYGISPVDGKENLKVWPKGENTFCLVKGEKYNVEKPHPFFEGDSKDSIEVLSPKKVLHDNKSAPNKGSRS